MMVSRQTLECLSLAATFVGSLYAAPAHIRALRHDDPRQIKQRSAGLFIVCLLSVTYVVVTCTSVPVSDRLGMIGIRISGMLPAIFLPLGLTATLFMGPIVESICEFIALQRIRHDARCAAKRLSGSPALAKPSPFVIKWPSLSSYFDNVRNGLNDPSTLRTLVLAPFTEELVFRGCMTAIMIHAELTPGSLILTLPLFFGVAHAHHLYRLVVQERRRVLQAVLICTFQFTYTTLFGIYATFILLRTGHLLSAILCHAFCNYMGFPDFGWLTDSDSPVKTFKGLIGMSFCVGIAGFYLALYALTSPSIYSSESEGFWSAAFLKI